MEIINGKKKNSFKCFNVCYQIIQLKGLKGITLFL